MLGQLYIAPEGTIMRFVDGSPFNFHCYHAESHFTNYIWLINGTIFNGSYLRGILSMSAFPTETYLLVHRVIPKLNNTIINCTASSPDGNMESSREAVIVLQGKVYLPYSMSELSWHECRRGKCSMHSVNNGSNLVT